MITYSRLCTIVLALGSVGWGQDPDWPGFRGPTRDGIAAHARPPLEWGDQTNVRFRTPLPGPGSSSPIIVGDRVYVTCYSGYGAHLEDGGDRAELKHHIVCVNRKDGSILWDRVIPGPLKRDARQMVLNEHGFASPTPECDGERIYVYFGRAGVVAVDLDGEVLWRTDMGVPTPDAPSATNSVERNGRRISLRWGSAATPVLFEDLVIINASEESNSIRALNRMTGALVWKRESADLEGCAISPIITGAGDAAVCVMVLAGQIWGLDPRTGEQVWSVSTESRTGMCPTPVADAERVYTFGGTGDGVAVRFARDLAGAEGEALDRVAWRGPNVGVPSPVLHGGRLFSVDSRGMGKCFKASDGNVLFSERLEGRTGGIYASPVLADGRLYVVSRKKGTFVYSADGKFALLARNQLSDDSQFNGSPALSGDELYLRSDKHLFCIREG